MIDSNKPRIANAELKNITMFRNILDRKYSAIMQDDIINWKKALALINWCIEM